MRRVLNVVGKTYEKSSSLLCLNNNLFCSAYAKDSKPDLNVLRTSAEKGNVQSQLEYGKQSTINRRVKLRFGFRKQQIKDLGGFVLVRLCRFGKRATCFLL